MIFAPAERAALRCKLIVLTVSNPTDSFTLSQQPQICKICAQIRVLQKYSLVIVRVRLEMRILLKSWFLILIFLRGEPHYISALSHAQVVPPCSSLVCYYTANIWRLNSVNNISPLLDVSHLFYIARYGVPSGHNVMWKWKLGDSRVWCVLQQPADNSTVEDLKYSHKVTTNKARYKLAAQSVSSCICSASSMAMRACIQTRYTHHWVHKSISKTLPQAFPFYNTPIIWMDMDCHFSLQHFPSSFFAFL